MLTCEDKIIKVVFAKVENPRDGNESNGKNSRLKEI